MKELNLMLHCGGYRTALDKVATVALPKAEGKYVPVAHLEVHNCVTKAITAAGLRIVTQIHALAANDQRYFGMYQLINGKENNEMGLVLATRNSHDKSFKAGVAVGEGVFACDNLAFSAEVVLNRMHTTHIMRDLPALYTCAVGMLADKWTSMEQRVAAYKQHELNDAQVNDFVIRSADAGAINFSNIPDVLKEWRTPSIPEFSAAGRCAWRLFNAFTDGYKRIENPALLVKRSQVLHALMDVECDILTKDKVIDVEALVANN